MKYIKLCLTLVAVFLFVACSGLPSKPSSYSTQPEFGPFYSKTVHVFYSGSILPFEEVSVITYDSTLYLKVKNAKGEKIEPDQIFGKKGIYPSGLNQYHLQPGRYLFSFGFMSNNGQMAFWSKSDVEVSVELKKGEVIHFYPIFNDRQWGVAQRVDLTDVQVIKSDFNQSIKSRIK